MFNFTSTTFIHGRDQFAANPSADGAKTQSSSVNTLWVQGPGLFKQDDVVAIYRNPYVNPVAGKLIVDVCGAYEKLKTAKVEVSKNTRFRLNFYLRRSGDVNSYYANDFVFKGKDFHYEWMGTKSAAAVAKMIKKINRLYGDIYMNVYVGKGDQALAAPEDCEVPETDENLIVFENDNFGLFTEATLEMWNEANSDCCTYREGGWVAIDEITQDSPVCDVEGPENCSLLDPTSTTTAAYLQDGKDTVKVVSSFGSGLDAEGSLFIIKCVNGTGTYEQLLRDLRLPTMENMGWNSLTNTMREMPIPGNKYVQYTLHLVTCRGILGGSAVGEVTHSKTTHVFFVPADCCACASGLDAAFLQAIKDAGMEKLLVDVVAGVVGDGKGAAGAEKTDHVKSPDKVTIPVHEEKEDTRTNDVVAKDGCCLVEEDSCDCEEEEGAGQNSGNGNSGNGGDGNDGSSAGKP